MVEDEKELQGMIEPNGGPDILFIRKSETLDSIVTEYEWPNGSSFRLGFSEQGVRGDIYCADRSGGVKMGIVDDSGGFTVPTYYCHKINMPVIINELAMRSCRNIYILRKGSELGVFGGNIELDLSKPDRG